MKNNDLWLYIIVVAVLLPLSIWCPILFLVILAVIGIYLMSHKVHNRDWLLKHKQKLVNKSNNKQVMSNIIDKLYQLNFKFMSHAQNDILQIPNILRNDEQIEFAQCGLEYSNVGTPGDNSTAIILLITNQRLLVDNGMVFRGKTELNLNLNQIIELKYSKSYPIIHNKSKLVIYYKSKNYKNLLSATIGKLKHTPANAEKEHKEIIYLFTPEEFNQIQKLVSNN